MIYLGCAGWSVAREYAEAFPADGTHLQRYAGRLNAVEINSSFYRPHRPATYARWGASVPDGFRFAVKVPREITHTRRLVDCDVALSSFLDQCGELGERLGCLLVQLPPSLVFEPVVVERFFDRLRQVFAGAVAVEPRHASWTAAQSLLVEMRVAQVAADPPRFGVDSEPGGWPGLVYWRLHGAPRMYVSEYSQDYLKALASRLAQSDQAGVPTWCIFDNTAAGAALGNALQVRERIE
ncbi:MULTISPECIES: DUF72 domain-containing protein [unclassified Pseudomonas]|uniref:DUF72 domain-containing protein n=1 Tax=unclassified Pseudomonas TaxID=196821 RepID=UPI0021C96602|nr:MULTISPECIES: DUF72 domain-containing protein [unclassified Pseudomonas]MCU1730782.1 DUF72 domain-containing protein [Pseudomonas sp. 20P_3.2_Bac4]MCU1743359.1 DUF72 domain-containing protein [Pseudomonas sp. 20P_3.2_Bac5]